MMDDFTLWERELRRESGIQALLTQLDAVEAAAASEREWLSSEAQDTYAQ